MATPLTTDSAGTLSFACPRCAADVHEQFYGPCTPCREALRIGQRLESAALAVSEYAPKMNVTPNFIATKD